MPFSPHASTAPSFSRRRFLAHAALAAGGLVASRSAARARDDRTSAAASHGSKPRTFDVLSYGVAVGDVGEAQARTNAQAIETAVLEAAASGAGAVVRLPPGLVLVHLAPADYDGARSRYRTSAIRCAVSDIVLEGAGESVTTLKAFHDGRDAYSYSVLQIGVPPLDNGNADVRGVTLRALTLDGNHFFARPGNHQRDLPVAASAVRVEGMRRCVFADLTILNAGGYAIGLQNGGYIDNRFERITIRNAMADGVDVKDNGGVSEGNVLSSIRVERFGLATLPKHPFAGVDIMGRGWRLDGVDVSNWGQEGTPGSGLRFKQGGAGASRGYGAVGSVARNVRIAGRPAAPQPGAAARPLLGVHVKCENVSIDGLTVSDVGVGVVVSQPNVTIARFDIRASTVGIVQRDRESREQAFDGADALSLSDGAIAVTSAKAVGVDFSRPGLKLHAVRFDVPLGVGWLARRDFAIDEAQSTFTPGTRTSAPKTAP